MDCATEDLDTETTEDVGSGGSSVGLGVPDTGTNNGGTSKGSGTEDDRGQGNGVNLGGNNEGSLLRAVGEGVVTSAHVVEGTSIAHRDQATIEVGLSQVEAVAVLDLVIAVLSVIGNVGATAVGNDVLLRTSTAAAELAGVIANGSLAEVSQTVGIISVGEHALISQVSNGHVGTAPVTRVGGGTELNHVGAISAVTTVTSLSTGLSIRASPLGVDEVADRDGEGVGDKVVLNGRVGLNDVTTATTNVQVPDLGGGGDASGARLDGEGMRTVLEGTTELRGIDGESQVHPVALSILTEADSGVTTDRGNLTVLGEVNQLTSSVNGTISTVVLRGDVVTDTEDASGRGVKVVGRDGVKGNGGDDPTVVGGSSTLVRVTQVVITSVGSGDALRGRDTPGGDDDPLVTVTLASVLVVLNGTITEHIMDVHPVVPVEVEDGGLRGNAHTLGGNVLRHAGIVVATLGDGTRSQDSDIAPEGWVPVGIVVALLIALETTTSSTVVLTSVDGRLTDVLIGDEQTLVTLTGVAVTEVLNSLVVAILELLGGRQGVDVVGSSVVASTITNPRTTHVLQDQLAVVVGVLGTATVLSGPLNLEERSGIVGHAGTPAITTVVVVLRVEQTSLVVGITTVAVVRTTRVVQVDVRHGGREETAQDKKNGSRTHLHTKQS